MDFEPKNMRQDQDRLWMTFSLVTVVFRSKTIRYAMVAILVLHVSTIFVELSFLFAQPQYFRKYAPWLLLKPFGIATTIGLLAQRRDITNVWEDLELWAYDSAGEEVQRKIEKAIRSHHRFIILTISVGAVFAIAAGLPNSSDCDFYFNLFLFRSVYPKYSLVFNVIMKGLYGPLLCSMLLYPFFINYCTQHCLYQIYMWLERLENLTFDYDDKDDIFLIHDQQYQLVVHERLKFISKRHQDLLRFANTWSGHLQDIFVAVVVCSFCLGLSFAMAINGLYTEVYEISVLNIIIVASFAIVATIAFCSTMSAGQVIETETGKFTEELYSIRWLTFTRSNLNTLLNIMTIAGRGFKLKYSETYFIGHELGFGMAKGIYSVASVFYSTRS